MTYTLACICGICGMLSLIFLFLLPSRSLPYVYALCFGLGYAATACMPPIVTGDFFPGKTYGRIFGTILISSGLGGAIGAWFAGFVHDQWDSYLPVFIWTAICFLIACWLIWKAAPRKTRSFPVRR